MTDARARRARPIIAIDGPASAGKSTVALGVARALGFTYLNTGAMYRAVALAARAAGLGANDDRLRAKIAALLGSIRIAFDGERVLLNDRDVTDLLAQPEISDLASRFSTLPEVRERMRELQRQAGAAGGIVMEGRDIGTVVFPDAEFKVFLDAELAVRADRRFLQLEDQGLKITRAEVVRQLAERDRRDRSRELAPLVPAPDAIVIDSTDLEAQQVIVKIATQVERRFPHARA